MNFVLYMCVFSFRINQSQLLEDEDKSTRGLEVLSLHFVYGGVRDGLSSFLKALRVSVQDIEILAIFSVIIFPSSFFKRACILIIK